MRKLAEICINPDGTRRQSSEIDSWADAFSDFLKTDHAMKGDTPRAPGRIGTNELLVEHSKKAELQYVLKKVAEAPTPAVRRTWVKKAADYMGNTNENELEQAVFTLSSHFIKDKAPKLFDLNYFVGFRVLDKSDDNTKVVGIYGFKIGKTWVYIPIFFDKGKLNGYELCYIQNKDQFVPLKEGWVDWIINSAGDEAFGQADDVDMRQLGVRYPDMRQLTQPPIMGKAAAAVAHLEPWVQQGVLGFIKCAAAAIDERSCVNLEKTGSEDPRIFARLAVACDTYPLLKVAMEAFYGEGVFERMYDGSVKTAARKCKKGKGRKPARSRRKRAAVQVITRDDTNAFQWLTEKQAEDLIGGPIAIDERADDEVATLEDEVKLTSPSGTGVYDVFCADGTFRECLVIVGPLFGKRKPSREICLVIDWKRRKHIYAKTMAVLCAQGSDKEGWFNRLPADAFKTGTRMTEVEPAADKADTDDETSAGWPCNRVIIAPNGEATVPLNMTSLGGGLWRIRASHDFEDHRDRTYDIQERYNVNIGLVLMLSQTHTTPERELGFVKGCQPSWAVCSASLGGTRLVVRDDKLIIPTKVKYIDLDEKSSAALLLGTENDVVQLLHTNRKKLTVTKTAGSNRYVLDGKTLDRTEAFKTLVLDYSFRAKTASDILEACDQTDHWHVLKIPYVLPRHKTAELPIDPVFLGGGRLADIADSTMSPVFTDNPIEHDGYSGIPIQSPIEEAQRLGYEDQPTPIEWTQEIPPPDPMAAQQAAEAAQTGHKNVFDVSMLAALLKTNRSDELIGEYSKTFKLALSHTGRTLFKLFWDRESFIDRFGDEDMEKFEDLLKDVFSNLGDLVLYLSSKDDRPEVSDFLDAIGEEAD